LTSIEALVEDNPIAEAKQMRVDNVLLKDGQLKWIDFMHSTQSTILQRVTDFSMLFSSLTGVDQKRITEKIREILDPPIT
jgi:hypothetical protein